MKWISVIFQSMDPSKFTSSKTGTLLPIATPEQDIAFIPSPLPPSWNFDPDLWPLLSDAKRYIGELNGLASNLNHPELFLIPLQRLESLKSSKLEGTFATAQELMLFELDSKEPTNASDRSNSWQEVNNYTRALMSGYEQLSKLPFCNRLIKNLHKTLLRGVRGTSKNPGEFRSHQVHIGSNRRYVPPPPSEAIKCLEELEVYLNHQSDDFDPLVKCFIVHYQLEAIHPFSDGNGRIGRVVLALMIYKWCNLSMPWLYMSQYFERYKDEYIDNLFRISTHGAWREWLEFCLRGVCEQAQKAMQTCTRLRDLKADMHKKTEQDCSTRTHPIIEDLFSNAFVRVTDIARKFSVTYSTAKRDLEHLVKKGILRELPGQKVKTYYASAIIGIAYVDNMDEES